MYYFPIPFYLFECHQSNAATYGKFPLSLQFFMALYKCKCSPDLGDLSKCTERPVFFCPAGCPHTLGVRLRLMEVGKAEGLQSQDPLGAPRQRWLLQRTPGLSTLLSS